MFRQGKTLGQYAARPTTRANAKRARLVDPGQLMVEGAQQTHLLATLRRVLGTDAQPRPATLTNLAETISVIWRVENYNFGETLMSTPEILTAVNTGAAIPELDVHTTAKLAATVRIVDVREPHEFVGELGHIEQAELVPLAGLEAEAEGWDRTQELILVCRSGARSGRATEALRRLGFGGVVNMRGGMLAYNDAQLRVVR
jgi:rhodanese-related sulfurtransferase